ncbi:MAG: AbrB family transcriptional regulator [Rhizobiales bacterium]|nr:AbrB family transcriptional regulator [Hyphomicrobiales bacterium]
MVGTVIAVLAGVKFDLPAWLKAAAFILLGIQTGTSVSWETLARAWQWPISIAFMSVAMIGVTWAGYVYYTKRAGWDRATAFFASLPGALALVLMLADTARADMRRVTISQCIRLFFLVAALPAVIALLSPPHVMIVLPEPGGVLDVAILVLVSAAAALLLDRLKVPAGLILGSALVSAILGLSGLVRGGAPPGLLIISNVVLGVMIGARFAHFSLAELKQSLADGFSCFLIALAISSAGAAITAVVAGLPFALTLLAFAPGGLEAMTIMSFALDLDPAYVAAHQVVRYVAICLFLPPVVSIFLRRRA